MRAKNISFRHLILALASDRHALLFLPRVVQLISIETPALLKRLKTIPSRVALSPACQQSWPTSLESREVLVSNCCSWSDYVFHLPVTAGPIVFCMSQEHIVLFKIQRMSFSHAPSFAVSLRSRQFRSISLCWKMPQISSVFLLAIHSHFILPPLASCHHPTKRHQNFSHPIPSEFFQRFTPRFLPTSHYFGLFISVVPRPASSSSVYSAQYLFYPFHPTIFDIS